jgi:hypothetical protein
LFLDRIDAPAWAWGIFGAAVVLSVAAWLDRVTWAPVEG